MAAPALHPGGRVHFIGIFNRHGGQFRSLDLDAFCAKAGSVLAEQGHTFECRPVVGEDLLSELDGAIADRPDVLLAGGGDGTASAVAKAAFGAEIALAVLPGGTMNLFARALHLPLELDAALRVIAHSPVRRVDIASVNGRPFLHQYSVGLHTRLVRIRKQFRYRGRYSKMLASARAFTYAVVRPPRFMVEVRTTDGHERRECSAVIVSNGPLPSRPPLVGGEQGGVALNDGKLGVYVARPLNTVETMRLSLDILLGRWKLSPLVFANETDSVTLTFPRRKSSAQATIDGELVPLERKVELKVHPGALRVVAPEPG